MICLRCDKDVQVGEDGFCDPCRKELASIGRTPEEMEQERLEQQAKDAQVLLGEIVKLIVNKHPNVTLNALGTAVGTVIGQIDHPTYRKKVHYNFDRLVDEVSRKYTSRAIQEQFKQHQAKFQKQQEENGPEKGEDPIPDSNG